MCTIDNDEKDCVIRVAKNTKSGIKFKVMENM